MGSTVGKWLKCNNLVLSGSTRIKLQRKMSGSVLPVSITTSSASPPRDYYRTTGTTSLSFPVKQYVNGSDLFQRNSLRCNSTTPGQNESKSVLDAFFLGKALAEALNERIESTVGEFLSTVGRVQAEQQKQVQEFQEEVLERAKRAKEVAAREAMGVQGLTQNFSDVPMSINGNGVSVTASSAWKSAKQDREPPAVSTMSDGSSVPPSLSDVDDPLLGRSIED